MPKSSPKRSGTVVPEFLEARTAPTCHQVRTPPTATPRHERAEMNVTAWAYKRGNRLVEQTAPWVPLVDQPKDWRGEEYNAAPESGPESVPSAPKPQRTDEPVPRTSTYRLATVAHLDLDTLTFGELVDIERATRKRVGERRWRHAGPTSRAVMLADTVNAPFTVKL